MKKFLQKIIVLVFISLFMTSCFSTQQSCGLAQTKKYIKKAPVHTSEADVVVLKAE